MGGISYETFKRAQDAIDAGKKKKKERPANLDKGFRGLQQRPKKTTKSRKK